MAPPLTFRLQILPGILKRPSIIHSFTEEMATEFWAQEVVINLQGLVPTLPHSFIQQVSASATPGPGDPAENRTKPLSSGSSQSSGEDRQETNGQVHIQLRVIITGEKTVGGVRRRVWATVGNALLLLCFSGVVTEATILRCPQPLLPHPNLTSHEFCRVSSLSFCPSYPPLPGHNIPSLLHNSRRLPGPLASPPDPSSPPNQRDRSRTQM